VIILGNWNEEVQSNMVSTPLQTLGLKDAVITFHHASPPNTYNQGQFPIDRIFLQAEWIPQVTGSYLAFDQGVPSDHRAIWVDLPIDLLGWNAPTTSVPIWARHLKCDDPHVVKHHNNILDEKVKKQGIYEVLNQLYVQTAGCQLLVTQQRCLEHIDNIATTAKLAAEQQCQKLTVGKVLWCPRLAKARAVIQYWTGVHKHLSDGHIGAQILTQRAKMEDFNMLWKISNHHRSNSSSTYGRATNATKN